MKSSLILLSSLLFESVFGCAAVAQITPDGTTTTTVTPIDTGLQIDNGNRAGGNLFHSFGDFSVDIGREAFFNNANDIVNIFSRVTGGNISNIDGLIRANSAANLFLINPAGIVFGEGASLQLGGSFYGTTGNSIIFPDGEFSATDLDNPPLLTINAPIGVSFRDNPGEIVNYSVAPDEEGNPVGLTVPEDKTIGLIGGEITIDGGFITTPGGRIELGSVGENSVVTLTEVEQGWDFTYEEVDNFREIKLSFAALIDTSGIDPGGIELQGKNISLTEGSRIAVNTEVGTAGDINVIGTESVSLDGLDSFIFSEIYGEATGEGSEIRIETPQLSLTNGAQIYSTNLGVDSDTQGVSIVINASDIVVEGSFASSFDEESEVFPSSISATVELDGSLDRETGFGKSGNISINTDTLTLNEGEISNLSFGLGTAGDITVIATESVSLDGLNTSIFSEIYGKATGERSEIRIETPQLSLTNGAQIYSTNLGIDSDAQGVSIVINASDIVVEGFSINEESEVSPSGISATVELDDDSLDPETGFGQSGNITINTNTLTLNEGGQIDTGTFGQGNAGNLTVNATESIDLIGTVPNDNTPSALFADVGADVNAMGNSGDLTITTKNLTLTDGAQISSSARNEGNGGNLTIDVTESILVTGASSQAELEGGGRSGIFVGVEPLLRDFNTGEVILDEEGNPVKTTGNGGTLNIASPQITVENGGQITANTFSLGTGGDATLNVCLLYTSPSPRDLSTSRMPSSA